MTVTDEAESTEHQAPWPVGPSRYPCLPGRGRAHYVKTDRSDGSIVWVCVHCSLRYRFGEGLLP